MFTTIVVASDGSETADRAVQTAHALAREDGARIVLARVNELMAGRGGLHPVHPNEDQIQLKVRLQAGELKASGLDVELRICSTMHETARRIAEIAKDCHADLVVAGGSRRGALGRLLFGDVAQRMPRLVPCPVLLVPPQN